jgi:CSLREA domain-containing protein
MPAAMRRAAVSAVVAAGMLVLAPGGSWAATITVDVTNDEINGDGDCSLREAIQSANTNAANTTGCEDGDPGPAVDTIVLMPGSSYSLSISPDATPDDNDDGDLDVNTFADGPVMIQGGSSATGRATIGGGGDRVIDHLSGGSLTLTGVVITDGSLDDPIAPGGGIFSHSGSLTLVDSIVFDNHSEQADGGGIAALGTLTIQDSLVVENSAGGSGGGISQAGGPLTIDESSIGSNEAGTDPGASSERGGGVHSSADEVTISDSTFNQNGVNGSGASGGGLALTLSTSGTKTIAGSTFTGNDAGQLGAGIFASFNSDAAAFTVEDTRIEGNDAGPGLNPSVSGGGIRLAQGELELVRSVVRDNDATSATGVGEGGGLALGGNADATIDDSAIVANHATSTSSAARGGGIVVDGDLLLRRSTIASNTLDGVADADRGAGIFAGPNSASVHALNLTVHGNQALDAGSRGGGIHVQGAGSSVSLVSSTIASNFAGGVTVEPGDALSESPAGPLIIAKNSIIDGPSTGQVCDGTISSSGFNVATGTSCGLAGTGDLQNATPMLEPLAANGGLVVGPAGDTEAVGTRALMAGSPAIDHVPVLQCDIGDPSPLETDARAFPRPFGSACDAGAYELTRCYGEVVGEGAIVGTEGDDVVAGMPGPDLLFGLAGEDTLKGKGRNDRLCGGEGKDLLKGGKGNDKLDGGPGTDTCKGGPGHDKAKSCEKKSGIP